MLTAQQMVVLSDAELEKLLLVGGLAQLYHNPIFGVNTTNYDGFLKSAAKELWLAACRVSNPVQLSTLAKAVESYSAIPKLRFLDKVLNSKLSPCILSRGITEIVGEASCGKTQFCLQVLLDTITPIEHGGLGKGALYLHTEGEFPHKRWEQLKKFRLAALPKNTSLLDGQLVVRRITSVEEMEEVLELIRPLSRAKSAGVVIVDSVASLVREVPVDKKASVLYRWACFLQEASDDVGVPIITTNQVIDFIEDNISSANYVNPKSSFGMGKRNSSFVATGRVVLPALGLRWSEMVTARLALTRSSQHYDGPVTLSKAPKAESSSAPSSSEAPTPEDPNDASTNDDYAPTSKRRKLTEDPLTIPAVVTPQSWADAAVVIRKVQVLFSPAVAEFELPFFIDAVGLHSIE